MTPQERKAGRPPKPDGVGKPVRINADLYSKARIVAFRKNMPLGDYMSGIMQAQVERDFQQVMKDVADEADQRDRKTKKGD